MGGVGDDNGFVTGFGSKWGWESSGRVFTPQLVMYAEPQHFHANPAKIDADIETFLVQHGFDGFHVGVACRWFDLDEEDCRNIPGSNPPIDQRTFDALALLITKTHAAGGMVHLWIWGDAERGMNPSVRGDWGGLNGSVDLALQQQIAQQLGPLPGWTAGYGFDLDEWVTIPELTTWHDNLQSLFVHSHLLGGRPEGPNSGLDHSPYVAWNSPLDYASYEHHRPSYAVYVAALDALPDRPVMSEDRFRVRDEGNPKDYTLDDIRRGLWHAAMAGGVANIWGYLMDGGSHELGSAPFPNQNQIKTYSRFFADRFLADLARCSGDTADPGTTSLCLERTTNAHYLFYRENSASVGLDLSTMTGPQPAVAVDTKLPYAELALGILETGNQTWTAPYASDWAVAVGRFDSSAPPTKRFTDETAVAGLDVWQTNDLGGWHGTYVADFDGDADEDLFMTSHGIGTQDDSGKNALFRNNGDRTFTEMAATAGLDGGWHGRFTRELHGASWLDYDHDGDLDIYFPNTDSIVSDTEYHGYDELYRNDGDGTFSDVSSALGLPERDHGRRGGIAADIEGDGDLDLVFVNAADENHNAISPYENVYVNQGGNFSLQDRGMEFVAWSEGITSLDYDGDDDVDFAVANEEGGRIVLWQNDGGGNFTDVAGSAIQGGNDGVNGSVTAADVDNDGDLDLYTNKGLYRNSAGVFQFVGDVAGNHESMFFADLDNDGFQDLVADGLYYWDPGQGDYVRDDAGITIPGGSSGGTRGGMAFDYDNDGDLDLVFNISDRVSPYLRFYRNQLMEDNTGSTRVRWLQVLLSHTSGQLGCPGAKIWIWEQGTANLLGYREVTTATGFVSGPSYRQHFGLAGHEVVDVEVRWPTGEEETFAGVDTNQLVELSPGGPQPGPAPPSNLRVVGATASQVDLVWQDNSSQEDGYEIERAPDQTGSPGSFGLLDTVGANTGVYSDTAVNPGVAYWYRVVAVGGGSRSAPSNEVRHLVTDPADPLEVTVLSPAGYQVAPLGPGDTYYIDREYLLVTVPALLDGALWIKTANDDKEVTSESYLSFSVSQAVAAYVAFDPRAAAVPDWLAGWTPVAEVVGVSDASMGYFDLYRKELVAGTWSLGGNSAAGSSWPVGKSNYVVVLLPLGGVDTIFADGFESGTTSAWAKQ